MVGIGDDDEERLHRFLPDWQKNSQLLLLGNKDGKMSYLDMSFLLPEKIFRRFHALAHSPRRRRGDRAYHPRRDGSGRRVDQFLQE